MMAAILEKGEEKEDGMRILNNVKIQMNAAKIMKTEEDMNPDEDEGWFWKKKVLSCKNNLNLLNYKASITEVRPLY